MFTTRIVNEVAFMINPTPISHDFVAKP